MSTIRPTESLAKPFVAPASAGIADVASVKKSVPALWFDLLLALPAVIAAGALVSGLVLQARRGTEKLELAYRADATQRMEKNDNRGALIDFKRLTALDPNREEYRLAMATVLERLGDVGRAEALARTMAPLDDRKGYGSARIWLVRRLMADHRNSTKRLDDAEKHLRHFLKFEPSSKLGRLLLGDLYAMTNRLAEARPLLEAVATDDSPEMLILLAGVCRAMGDAPEADRRLDQAIGAARKMKEAAPDDVVPYLYWSNALLARKNFEDALKALSGADRDAVKAKLPPPREGSDPTDPIRQQLATICADWVKYLYTQDSAARVNIPGIIERGLAYNPRNVVLLSRLSDLLAADIAPADRKRIREWMVALTSDKQMAPMANFALGDEAWAAGKRVEARTYWEKSVSGSFVLPLAANNLAYALAYTEPKDLSRALELAEAGLKTMPKEPILLGTRGQVFNRLGRWKESVTDLEKAIQGNQTSPGIRAALAESYEKLGLTEKAASQKKLADPN